MNITETYSHQPLNKGKLVGQKAPLRLGNILAIRVRSQQPIAAGGAMYGSHTLRRTKASLKLSQKEEPNAVLPSAEHCNRNPHFDLHSASVKAILLAPNTSGLRSPPLSWAR